MRFYAITRVFNIYKPVIIGSYGWGGKMVKTLSQMIPNLKVEIIDPVIIKGFPRDKDFKAFDILASSIADKHKEHNLI